MRSVRTAILLVILSGAAAVPDANASRWSLGIGAEAVRFEQDEVGDLELDPAAGIRLLVGFDLAPGVPLRLALHASRHDAGTGDIVYQFGGIQLEIAYRFRQGARLQPFLLAGIGGNGVVDRNADERETVTNGPSSSIGAGLVIPFDRPRERFSLELGAAWTPLNWNEVEITETTEAGDTIESTVPIEDSGSAFRAFGGLLIHF